MGYSYDDVDLRERPEEYRVGRGEQGVFHAEPYKSELLLWDIYARYLSHRASEDFVGMEVARESLQMGYTRARRYAKYAGGNKSRPRD